MYEKVKTMVAKYPRHYYIIGALIVFLCVCAGYILYQPSGGHNNDSLNTVERIESQQRESVELNRSVQRSIDRSTDLSHEAATRIDRSQEYNHEIGERITNSQGRLSEARIYLERNAELFRRIEEQSRERQGNYQTSTDTTQPIPDGGSGGNHWSGNSSMNER